LAVFLDAHRDTLYEWTKHHPEFSDILDALGANQAEMLIDMRRVLHRVNLELKRFFCRFFGHKPHTVSFKSVGLTMCLRCLKMDRRIVRKNPTKGEIEQRMADYPPQGYSFVSCNWKKHKARFVSRAGQLKFVSF
jgi:hypothetical protein